MLLHPLGNCHIAPLTLSFDRGVCKKALISDRNDVLLTLSFDRARLTAVRILGVKEYMARN
jgi:hypothetical protein